MKHAVCGAQWDVYCTEWPPPLTICPGCQAVFKLASHDPESNKVSFRRIT